MFEGEEVSASLKTQKEIDDMKLADSKDLTLKYSDRIAKVMFRGEPLFTITFGCGDWVNAKDDVAIYFNATASPEWNLVECHQVQGSIYFRIMRRIKK